MNVLLLIDLQNDFMPGGSLAVSGADKVIPIANTMMKRAGLVVATQDWHPANHGSFASQHADCKVGDLVELAGLPQIAWPDHCIENTIGAGFHPDLNFDDIHHIIHKGTDPKIDSYSGFFDNGRRAATGLHHYLQSQGAIHLHVMGVATDYCVKFTVLDALSLGYQVTVNLDGCRGVELTPGDIDLAVQEMSKAGASVQT
ncbi:bifunctional nicotinamidase/pyrazinamidase [Rubripirellula amarantea]|nr:bifunctional nicotinamidase/pyrazinamidase [Rubripirellula amarantea]